MDPQNSSPYCILDRDLKVLLQQSFNSLSQVFVAAYSSLLQPYLSVFSLFLCHDLKIPIATSKPLFSLKYVATLNSFVVTRLVH